ncbi:MAG: hydantoinase/oxoprolinase family protein [Pseudomonadota bacterium]
MLRIGIDVGGTHTDAVLLDGRDVVATTKATTSADVLTGIVDALDNVLAERPGSEKNIDAVMLGTTQFTNAVVERRELTEVAAVRLGAPSGDGLPPKTGWPDDIARALGDQAYMLKGGTLFDGHPLAAFDEQEVQRLIDDLIAKRSEAICVSAVFSPVDPRPEQLLGEKIKAALPNAEVTLSHSIGRLGLLERENAALLNASLLPFADRVVTACVAAIRGRGLTCQFFISQNDGTLMDADFARRFPALTFASGPTNSLRGAASLTGLDNAIVIDIGGTTSDIGVLQDGFPRESNLVIEVGGVRTNFRMPDILALGLGGGSVVSADGVEIGPQSVGHRLLDEAMVFGGDTLTASDVVVAAGAATIGDPTRVQSLSVDVIATAQQQIQGMLERGVETMKPSSDPLPVVLVGGGAILASETLAAAASIHRPDYANVANAIGAAIAQIGGESEQIVSYDKIDRDKALASVRQEAARVAIDAGVDAATLRVADVEETPIAYMAGNAVRLRVKVVGDVAIQAGPR